MSQHERALLEWLDGRDTGLSSKSIALVALGGKAKESASYPHDGSDFGRCYRLLQMCPEAKVGLDRLAEVKPLIWKALSERWGDIEEAYHFDKRLYETVGRSAKGYRCYDLMQSIIRPAEKGLTNPPVHLGNGISMSFGR